MTADEPSRYYPFIDRQGTPLSAARWARLRRDRDYCLIAGWRGEGGAHIETSWFGLDILIGIDLAPMIFATAVSVFANLPATDHHFRYYTEEQALDRHSDIVWLVERGIRPWDVQAVAATGISPLPP